MTTRVPLFAWGIGNGRGRWHRDAGPWADDPRVRRSRCGLRFAIDTGSAEPVDRHWPLCGACR